MKNKKTTTKQFNSNSKSILSLDPIQNLFIGIMNGIQFVIKKTAD